MRIPRFDEAGNPLPCVVDGCAAWRRESGMCIKHKRRASSGKVISEPSKYEKTAEVRFFEKVNKNYGAPINPHPEFSSAEPCWLWLGAKRGSDMKQPYGAFRDNGRQNTAHRWSYEFAYGTILDSSLTLDHLCRNRLCVNPDHMELVSSQVNTARRDDMRKLGLV